MILHAPMVRITCLIERNSLALASGKSVPFKRDSQIYGVLQTFIQFKIDSANGLLMNRGSVLAITNNCI